MFLNNLEESSKELWKGTEIVKRHTHSLCYKQKLVHEEETS